ncbi:Protein of unknown function [Pyronema omphalodes CBS 100304]|uniref:Uncharacterized protein n=1 Tax=Pyronema omphalodes (strain CBS 100304) TaxID=1076935 RepID=U4LRG0_PYROM|nr:Protein of unknown function [Pyronema omphalodes CBS 100304]
MQFPIITLMLSLALVTIAAPTPYIPIGSLNLPAVSARSPQSNTPPPPRPPKGVMPPPAHS